MQFVEDGLDRFALQRRQSRQDLTDWVGDVQERREGVLEGIDRVDRGLVSVLRSQLDMLRGVVKAFTQALTFCSAAIRFDRDLADGLGRGASDGTAPAGAGRATSSN